MDPFIKPTLGMEQKGQNMKPSAYKNIVESLYFNNPVSRMSKEKINELQIKLEGSPLFNDFNKMNLYILLFEGEGDV